MKQGQHERPAVEIVGLDIARRARQLVPHLRQGCKARRPAASLHVEPLRDPALHRLERRGLIAAEWGASDNNRRAKYYELTRAGSRALEAETQAWEKLTAAVGLVLRMA